MRRLTLIPILIVLVCAGCARGIGPRRLPVDRTAYIEALGESWKDQILMNIIKLRYDEAPTFLDITQILQSYTLSINPSANYNLSWGQGTKNESTNLTANLGGGGSRTATTGTGLALFPGFSQGGTIGGTYSNQPTVTYVPITGDVIRETIFTQLTPSKIFNALKAGWKTNFIVPYCIKNINNVAGISGGMDSDKIDRLVEIWEELDRKNAIFYTEEPKDNAESGAKASGSGEAGKTEKKGEKTEGVKPKANPWDKFADNLVQFTGNLVKKQKENNKKNEKETTVYINLVKQKDPDGVQSFKDILNLRNSPDDKDKYEVLPGPSREGAPFDKIYIISRSVYQVLDLLANYIDIPAAHEGSPNGEPWVWRGKQNEQWSWPHIPHFHVEVMSSWKKPDEFAAIKYQGYWFYIPNNDRQTKRVFQGLVAIFSMMESPPAQTPVLSIPVR